MSNQMSKDSVSALLTNQNRCVSNTSVIDGVMYLFGNDIMRLQNNDLYIRIVYPSRTTMERINCLSNYGYNVHLVQRKGELYLNGKLINDYKEWIKVNKEQYLLTTQLLYIKLCNRLHN